MAGILTLLSRLPLLADADWLIRLGGVITLMGVTGAGVYGFMHLCGWGRGAHASLWPRLHEWGLPVGFVLAGLLLLCADGVGWLSDMAGLSGARRVVGSEMMFERARTIDPPTPITCLTTTLCVQGCQP